MDKHNIHNIASVEDRGGIIRINGHRFRYGYFNGYDGSCDTHMTFACIECLTEEEKDAMLAIVPPDLKYDMHCLNNNIQQC